MSQPINNRDNGKGWPCHSSQEGLIKELLQQNIPVTLTYLVTPAAPDERKLKVEMEGKQRL